MSEIILKKPVSVLNRNVKFDLKDFFIQASSTVAGTAIQVATANPIGALTSIVKGLASASKTISLEDIPVEERAWLLVVSSLTHAIAKIMGDFNDLFENNIEQSQLNLIGEQINEQINEIEMTLTNNFFDEPHQLVFLDSLFPTLSDWLQQLGLNDSQAKSFLYQFRTQFPMSLHYEWGTNPTYYALIVEKLDTPFNTINRLKRKESEYRYWLQQQVNERIFEEAFGLSEIYVPLRAYYLQTIDNEGSKLEESDIEIEGSDVLNLNNENITKKVCNIHKEINDWLRTADIEDNLKVISGGPGSGKSSFAKILASELAKQSDIPVLFIPLHRFRISGYLPDAIRQFLDNHPILTQENLLDETNLLLIFDGLDELSMQGSSSKDIANNFTEELKEVLREKKDLNWKSIVTGRELSIQQQQNKLKKQKTILHLLPYFVDEEDRDEFDDSDDLLLEDQRNEWWQKLAVLKGLNFDKLPIELTTKHLEPITTEPLLNYLVSLSYLKENGIEFTKNTNLNEVYADLLDSVHKRKYADNRPHKSINKIDKSNFIRILEEIALTVWHENGRTASINQIMRQCEAAGISEYFDELKSGAESGVIRLLMAFYFREFDGGQGEKTFEFTHKSFGEYLTARRIMLELDIVCDEVERGRKNAGRGYTLKQAFVEWIKVCGSQRIDEYLRDFLDGEISILSESENGRSKIRKYQELLIELINISVNEQSPVKELMFKSFEQDLRHSRNSEIALLELHSLCAKITNNIIKNNNDVFEFYFSDWLNRLSYRMKAKINHLDLSHCAFSDNYLDCDLNSVCLDNTTMFMNDFYGSDISSASMKNCKFSKCSFHSVNLDNSDFTNTRCIDLNFDYGKLNYTVFNNVKLVGVGFINAEMKNVDFTNANLDSVDFINTNLKNANFNNAKLRAINFTNANLENANFEGTNHEEAIFTGANLKGTILEPLYQSEEKSEEEE